MKRDGNLTSLWQATADNSSSANTLEIDKVYDAVIIGAGITGVTTAYLLQKAGKQCVLMDAMNIGFGTTGGTTAHLNTFFDATYDEVISDFGKENALIFSEAGVDAINLIKKNIKDHNIDCGFEELPAYVFSVAEDQDKMLDDIVASTKDVGLPMDYVNDSPFPVPYRKIAAIQGQAQFHPLQYITSLAKAFHEMGGIIIEQCRATAIDDDGGILTVSNSIMNIKCRNAIYATHVPPGVNILHFRNAPYRSYAMAFSLKSGNYPQALGYDLSDPYHYYRSQKIGERQYLIAGGEDHKTGHEENTEQPFRNLEAYVRRFFDIGEVEYKWSSQYFTPTDGLPYIGHLPGNPDNVYVATGFNGNGITLGTLSGIILTDLIATGNSKYKDLFNPARVKPVAGFVNFVKESADVVASLVGDRLSAEKIRSLAELAPGEGRVVKYDGHTLALYKDESHKIHAVNSACTHIKCTVGWNSAEKTWDCPCHGSRFTYDGMMLNAPARKDLEVIHLDKDESKH